ncbi:MAG: twin-arginine translocase subunit TatC [Acidimicrobiales bacterium]
MTTTDERRGAASSDDGRMTLVAHLTELRNRVIKTVVAVAVGAVAGWFLYDQIFDLLIGPYEDICAEDIGRSVTDCALLVTDPLEPFSVRIKVATYGGIALAMPVILWQLWRFVSPGLYRHEKRYAIPFVLSALVLFALGAGIAYWTLPKALGFLATIGGENLNTAYSPSKYFQLIVYMMLAFGVGFEFPIVLIFLQMAGILPTSALRQFRRYAIVGIAVLVAVVTPSADPISMLALTIPMVAFYEGAIIFGRVRERRRRTRHR